MTAPTLSLSRLERRWAHATLDTLFPGPDRGALPAGILDMDVDGFLDETFRTVPFEAAIGLRLAFVVIALAPLFVLGKLATIASLSKDDRLRLLTKINASTTYAFRATVMMVKAMGSMFYCGDVRVRPSIVAVSPPVVTLRVRSDKRLQAPSVSDSSSSSSSSSSLEPGAAHEPHRRTA